MESSICHRVYKFISIIIIIPQGNLTYFCFSKTMSQGDLRWKHWNFTVYSIFFFQNVPTIIVSYHIIYRGIYYLFESIFDFHWQFHFVNVFSNFVGCLFNCTSCAGANAISSLQIYWKSSAISAYLINSIFIFYFRCMVVRSDSLYARMWTSTFSRGEWEWNSYDDTWLCVHIARECFWRMQRVYTT